MGAGDGDWRKLKEWIGARELPRYDGRDHRVGDQRRETVRWQPVSPTLMGRLAGHGRERHAPADGQLLRYADGRPITSRRYDHLWARIGRHLPWVATQGISSHWIRHILPA